MLILHSFGNLARSVRIKFRITAENLPSNFSQKFIKITVTEIDLRSQCTKLKIKS